MGVSSYRTSPLGGEEGGSLEPEGGVYTRQYYRLFCLSALKQKLPLQQGEFLGYTPILSINRVLPSHAAPSMR